MSEDKNALNLAWAFGFNKDLGVYSLSDSGREALFYAAAHVGVIYELAIDRQLHLIGHTNEIRCACVSRDKKWVATADQGVDSLLIVWDSIRAVAQKTIVQPFPDGVGTEAIALSDDGGYLAALSRPSGGPQQIAIWDWRRSDVPLVVANVADADYQRFVRFNESNNAQLISNGNKAVVFWTWNPARPSAGIEDFSPPLTSKYFRHPVSGLTRSMFLPDKEQAVSGTQDGDLVLWEWDSASSSPDEQRPHATKTIRVHDSALTEVTHTTDYVVTAGSDGFVRFYDFGFRLMAWYEELNAGPITCVSFANKQVEHEFNEQVGAMAAFRTVEFVVSTQRGTVLSVDPKIYDDSDPKKREGKTLMQCQDKPVHAVAAHPNKNAVVIGGYSGLLQYYDYTSGKRLRNSRKFEKLQIQTMSFEATGRCLAIGFTNGHLKFVSASTFKDMPTGSFRTSQAPIVHLMFSPNSVYCATADSDFCICVYKCNEDINVEGGRTFEKWELVGKHRSHTKPVTGVVFIEDVAGAVRLLSVAEDRMMVEYDLAASSITKGLLIKDTTKVEQTAIPTALVRHPKMFKEDLLVITNDQYKFKLLTSNTKTVRRTLLAPTYAGPLNRLIVIPNLQYPYLAYGTHSKVIGLIKLPLDGNPNRSMGMIAHPGEVADLVPSHDGRYLFTAGGADLSVLMWSLDYKAMDSAAGRGGSGLEPFAALLEGGRGGEFWDEFKEYFYFAQIRSQGEESTDPHKLGNTVPISQIPYIMRAVGFYPTEKEVEDLVNEVRFSKVMETGAKVEEVDFEELVRLYVNHRPVFGVGRDDIENAFRVLGASEVNGKMDFGVLLNYFKGTGEKMSDNQLQECLEALLGDAAGGVANAPITAGQFAEGVLGFEAYE